MYKRQRLFTDNRELIARGGEGLRILAAALVFVPLPMLSGAACQALSLIHIFTWNDFLKIVHKAMGQPNRKIINIPKWSFQLFGLHMRKVYRNKNVEGGSDPVSYTHLDVYKRQS